ncbi:tRNA pseudouridine synthase, putative [Plasmodium gallinaceum]|uniref:tRNA pseudouridine synthase, putative n=1 Tax=Plasmodium gallinaceum TaxID=5849 RepID=A0A1J1H377_PLAGA|nr:tRNA pseudouridine synthase, putative [Plasmodium gallinaceum]CRG97941.1 tRNA pseudouridine synthase, putative [Plasmodium gallinaceum]
MSFFIKFTIYTKRIYKKTKKQIVKNRHLKLDRINFLRSKLDKIRVIKKNMVNNSELNELKEKVIINREKLTNLILIIDYDGTYYNGWTGLENSSEVYLNATKNYKNKKIHNEKNENKYTTVQNTILNCILKIHGYGNMENLDSSQNLKPFDFIGVSRTDKGVHAKEYVCQYISYERKPPCNGNLNQIKRSLNSLLNKDIKILGVLNSPFDNFNVRYHNIGKIYTYNVDIRIPSQPFERNYAWQLYDDPRFSFLLKKEKKKIEDTSLNDYTKKINYDNKENNLCFKKYHEENLNFLFDEKFNDSNEDEEIINSIEKSNYDSIKNIKENEEIEGSLDSLSEGTYNNNIINENNIVKESNKDNIMGNSLKNSYDITHSISIINNKKEIRPVISCNLEKIKECSKLFIGYHNFECFRGTLKGTEKLRKINTFCNIHFLDVYELKNNLYQFVIQGDRFLYHMIRIIIGTLIQIGVGLLKIEDVKDALYLSKPLKVKLCAPSQGLCLKKILFNPSIHNLINSVLQNN